MWFKGCVKGGGGDRRVKVQNPNQVQTSSLQYFIHRGLRTKDIAYSKDWASMNPLSM